MTSKSNRTLTSVLLAVLMVAVSLPTALFWTTPEADAAVPIGFFSCIGAAGVPGAAPCPPAPVAGNGNGTISFRDDGVSVFVGRDFDVTGGIAESEGRTVVIGNMVMDKTVDTGNAVYDVGEAGVGSRVVPPDGTDYLVVGGSITVGAGEQIRAGVVTSGQITHGGAVNGTLTSDSIVQDANAVSAYAGVAAELVELSACLADEAQVVVNGATSTTEPGGGARGSLTLIGDGSSAIQVFSVPNDLGAAGGNFAGNDEILVQAGSIPAGATVIINMTKAGTAGAPLFVNTSTGLQSGGTLGDMREKILWNVPNSLDTHFAGDSQFQGSVLVGAPGSIARVSYPGMNGRFYAVNDVQHRSNPAFGGSSGNEFHSYPFTGEFPAACDAPAADPPTIEIEKATNGQDADTAPGPSIEAGQPVTWSYVVTHTGPVGSGVLSGIDVQDDVEGQVTCPSVSLAQGESMTCTAIVGAATVGAYVNTATVTAQDPDNTVITDDDPSNHLGTPPPATISIEKATNGQDSDTVPGEQLAAGSTVTWSYVVTHTGPVGSGLVTTIDVQDDLEGQVTCPSASLAQGESMTCTALTGQAIVGQYTNLATVTGSDNGTPIGDDDPSNYNGAAMAAIGIEKATNGVDADGPADAVLVPTGSVVTWTYVVTHTGAAGSGDLTNIDVQDDVEGQVMCPSASLAQGESMTCTALVGVATSGLYNNVATATGIDVDDGGAERTSEDPSHYTGVTPGLAIEKATNGADADLPADAVQLQPGAPVAWSYVVTHTGAAGSGDITNIDVQDDLEGQVTCPSDVLAPGESMTCTDLTGTAVLGAYANIATVTGVDVFDADVTADDPSNYLASQYDLATTIEFAAGAPESPVAVDDEVTYLVEVRNQGTVASLDYSFVVTLGEGLAYVSDTADVALNSIDNGDGTVTFTVAAVDGLEPAETVSFELVASVDDNAFVLYRADVEITADGGDIDDKDSVPDPAASDTNNDAVTGWEQDSPVTNHNDVTTDVDGNDDVFDDHDAETFINEPIYDLATTIEFAAGAPIAPIAIDDAVVYTVELGNQGSVVSGAYSFVVTMPEGMSYVSDTTTDAVTTTDNTDGTVTFDVAAPNQLNPGETLSFQVIGNIDDNTLTTYRADVEITADSGDVDDKDSIPDSGDTGGTDWEQASPATNHNDVTTDVDGTNDAFDDHDAELFGNSPVYDLATIIEFSDGAPESPVALDSTISYSVDLRNQGSVASEAFTVTVTLPNGTSYVSDTTPDAVTVTNNGDGTLTISVPAEAGLNPEQSLEFDVVANIDDHLQMMYRADVEITVDSGEDQDSDPGSADTNNDGATEWDQDSAVNNHNDARTDVDGPSDAFDDHDAEKFNNTPDVFTLSGFVRHDSNSEVVTDPDNTPMSGILITLTPANGDDPVTTTTNDDGFYLFENLLPGEYSVAEAQPTDYLSVNDVDGTDDDVIQTILIVAANVVNQDFLEEQVAMTIEGELVFLDPSGTVTTCTSQPAEGIKVTLFRAETADATPVMIADGNAQILDPSVNLRNPSFTNDVGFYRWDTIAGFYRVDVEQADGTVVSSALLPVPPPQSEINFELACNEPLVALRPLTFEPFVAPPAPVTPQPAAPAVPRVLALTGSSSGELVRLALLLMASGLALSLGERRRRSGVNGRRRR